MQRKGQKKEITPPDNSEWARERNPTQGVLWGVSLFSLSAISRDWWELKGCATNNRTQHRFTHEL